MDEAQKGRYRNFLVNYYLFRFLTDFIFLYAIYVILLKMRGMTIWQISLLLAIWCISVVLFEIPTGALADRWSRKNLLCLGLLSKAGGYLIWILIQTFWGFALGFFFWGLQEALCSGSQEALLYDNLRVFHKEGKYEQIAGRGYFYSTIGIAISMLIGGFLAAFNLDLVIALSIIPCLLGLIPTSQLPEPRIRKKFGKRNTIIKNITIALKTSKKKPALLQLFLYTMLSIAVIGTLEEYVQLYFHWIRLPISFFGFAAVVVILMQSIGGRYAYKWSQFFHSDKNIYCLSLMAGILLIGSVMLRSGWMFGLFILPFLLGSAGEIILEGRLQKTIKIGQRATILSINSLLCNLSGIVLAILFGFIAKITNIKWSFFFFGGLMIGYSIFSLFKSNIYRSILLISSLYRESPKKERV